MTYEQAPQSVVNLVEAIINEFHPELSGVDIGVLFKDEATKKGGKLVLGQARKAPPILKAYEYLHFLIILAKDQWDRMTAPQRRALIDHELCHCLYDYEREQASIRPHDIEEFNEIIDRHGLWTSDLVSAAPKFEEAQQRPLAGFDMSIEHRGKVVAIRPGTFGKVAELPLVPGMFEDSPEDQASPNPGKILKKAAEEFNRTNDPEKAHAEYIPGPQERAEDQAVEDG